MLLLLLLLLLLLADELLTHTSFVTSRMSMGKVGPYINIHSRTPKNTGKERLRLQ